MRGGLTLQQLLLIAFMVLGLLLNLLVRWIRTRAAGSPGAGAAPGRDAPPPVPGPARARVAPLPLPPAPAATPPGRPGPRPEERRPGRRRRAPSLGRREARRAIVHMAVLGPCRAVDPRGPDAIPAPPL